MIAIFPHILYHAFKNSKKIQYEDEREDQDFGEDYIIYNRQEKLRRETPPLVDISRKELN